MRRHEACRLLAMNENRSLQCLWRIVIKNSKLEK